MISTLEMLEIAALVQHVQNCYVPLELALVTWGSCDVTHSVPLK